MASGKKQLLLISIHIGFTGTRNVLQIYVTYSKAQLPLVVMTLNFVVPGNHSVEAKTLAAAEVGYAVLDCLVETSRNTMRYPLNKVVRDFIQTGTLIRYQGWR